MPAEPNADSMPIRIPLPVEPPSVMLITILFESPGMMDGPLCHSSWEGTLFGMESVGTGIIEEVRVESVEGAEVDGMSPFAVACPNAPAYRRGE